MYFKRRKKDVPRSDLRNRLEEYSSHKEKTWWYEDEELKKRQTLFDFFPLSVLRDMHSFLVIKISAALLIILLVSSFSLVRIPFVTSILGKIHAVTVWKTDLAALGREAAPVVKKLWEGNLETNLEKVVLAPRGSILSEKEERLLAPLEGDPVQNFGLQFNTFSQQEEMFYGLVFAAPAGTPVQAAAGGSVKMVQNHPGYGLFLLLEHAAGRETGYGYLQEVLVQEGDLVRQGQNIAKVGGDPLENNPALYFEIRENGEPVDPLPLLTGY
ncbi:MAG: M23 family metallopeptidase [Dethiobacteria bacterium]|jgi:murein DD-endopeptidase MepM/ murein hydrolase activator NlpD